MIRLIPWMSLALVVLLIPSWSATAEGKDADPDTKFDTEIERQSYALGAAIGENIAKPPSQRDSTFADLLRDLEAGTIDPDLEINLLTLLEAMQVAFDEKDLALSRKDLRASWAALTATMQQNGNLKISEAYLNENAQKDGVVTTESGLQYRIIEAGSGATPKATDRVKVHYTGTFIDGETFDSSVDRGSPAVFPVNQLIPGWTEALQLMHVGAKWELAIPSDLAYGQRGAGSSIPPNAALLFTLELIDIVE